MFRDERVQYKPLPSISDAKSAIDHRKDPSNHGRSCVSTLLLSAIIGLLIGLNILQLYLRSTDIASLTNSVCNVQDMTAGASVAKIETHGGYFVEEYRSRNDNIANAAWDAIEIGVGLVAMKQDWAFSHGLPIGMTWPPDPKRAVYSVAAYHPLHCVVKIRQAVKALLESQQPTMETFHIWHCLNTIREELMCSASDELLWIPAPNGDGESIAGYDQRRKCTDWRSLSAWAIEHSACFVPMDDEKAKHIKQWENCVPTDGILLP